MNEHEPKVGDVVSAYENEAIGVILEVIYPQETGDRGRVVFHWMKNVRGTFDIHPLSWIRCSLANGDIKLISRAESENVGKL